MIWCSSKHRLKMRFQYTSSRPTMFRLTILIFAFMPAASLSQPLFKWSSAGPIPGLICTQIVEIADPHTWTDNYLCSSRQLNLRWSSAGPISGMRCTQIHEAADPHTWSDNYLCIPNNSDLRFFWSSAGSIDNLRCVRIVESADPHTWQDNYLCYCVVSEGGWCP